MGQLDPALQNSTRAYDLYSKSDLGWAWQFRVQKAHVLVLQGYYRDALSLLSESLPDSLAHSEPAVRRKIIQGVAHDYSQEFEQADADLNEADQLAQSFQPMLVGDVLQAHGNLETHQKHFEQANKDFHAALDFSRAQNLPYLEGNVLGSLGYLAMWQEHYDEAIAWFRLALDKSQTLRTTFLAAKVAGNMGWNYSSIGDFENAELAFKKAVNASQDAGLVADRVYWLNALGAIYNWQRRYDEAAATLEQALTPARKMDNKRTLTECLNNFADLSLARGRIEQAEAYNREAIEIETSGLDKFGVLSSNLVAGRVEATKSHFGLAAGFYQKILNEPTASASNRWQAQALLAEAYAAEENSAEAEESFRQAIQTIEAAWASIQQEDLRLSFLSRAIEFYDAYINFLIEQGRPLDALKIADLSRAQTMERGLSSSPADKSKKTAVPASFNPQEIARRQNATILFYWLGQNRSHLWVITPSKTQLLPLPASAEIDAATKAYRESFLDPRDPLEYGNVDGKRLYDVLIRPAGKLIPKNSRIILLPDGSLNGLNFETLIVSGPQPHYWIEDATISIANSLALLAHSNRAPAPKPGNLLFFGDALPNKDFPALPDPGKEADILKKYFPDAHLFTGANAKASQYLSSNPAQFSYLHFATHGTASRMRPLESAIILSPEGDSFKLYARDIVEHPIHSFLVTISACDGAGKRVYAGEGLVGLSWAFLRAGAHYVVAGLWEVSSASTPQLMDELYKGLKAGQDPATALRNAKLSLLRSGGIFKKPFYWAPFQLYSGS